MKVKNKLILVLGASSVLVLSMMAIGLSLLIKKNLQNDINKELISTMNAVSAIVNSSAENAVKYYLKAMSEKANALCRNYELKVLNGEITREQAIEEIRKIFLDEYYGNIGESGYLAAVSSDGIILIHPSSKEGSDVSDHTFIQHAIELKEGYIEYEWKNPEDPFPREKASYITYFEPWDMIIWASSYIEDFPVMIEPREIRDHLLSIKIGDTGYPYVLDSEGTLIVHPLLEGTNLYNSTDADGRYFIKEMLEDPDGEGFMHYRWMNPGEESPRRKFQLYKRLDNFGWTVAISSYTDEYFFVLKMANFILLIGIFVSVVVILLTILFISNQIKNANVALLESEEKHKRLVDNLSREYFFYMQSIDGKMFYVSPSVTKMLGYSIDDFKEHYLAYLTDNPDNKIIYERLRDSFSGIKQPKYIVEIWDIYGNIKILEVTKTPVFNKRGDVIAVDGIAHDVTEKHRTAKELDNMKDYLSNIIDSMPSVIVGIDSFGIVTQWNKKAEEMTRIPFEEAKGLPLAKLIPRMKHQKENINKALKYKSVERDLRKKVKIGNSIRYEDITIYPIETKDMKGSVIRIDDITDKIRIEEMMIQSEKMVSIGGLAAGMAHEINNPLAGMMQTANVLKSRLIDDIPVNIESAESIGLKWEKIRKYIEIRSIESMLDRIQSSGSRAADIVSNMLSFSRKDDNTETEKSDITEIIKKSIMLAKNYYDIKKRFDFRKIEIIENYEDNLPLVPCKPAKIEQVLLNILCNGADAFYEQQENENYTNAILKIKAGKDNDQIVISIEDNGPGIDKETQKRIFEPFFTTKPTDKGTGLGLSVSYYIIVDDHKGELIVDSQVDQGTIFTIKLNI